MEQGGQGLGGARRVARINARAPARAGALDPEALDEAVFGGLLHTAGMPDPDLIVRTSGEQRLSNFVLWQAAYAEMVFSDVLWPDVDRRHLWAAVEEYARRDRRYGSA